MQIYGLDIDEFSPDEIVRKVGIVGFKLDQLFYSIQEGAEEAEYALAHDDHNRYFQAGLMCSPNAYETYRRLKKEKHPKIIKSVESLSQTNHCSPSEIKFWVDPSVIITFYNFLQKDGYYASATGS